MVKIRNKEARVRFYPTENEYAILNILVPAMFHDFLGHNHGDANIADAINRDMKKTKYVCQLLRGKLVTPGVVSKVRKKHGLHYRTRNGNGVADKGQAFVSYNKNFDRIMEKALRKQAKSLIHEAVRETVKEMTHGRIPQTA